MKSAPRVVVVGAGKMGAHHARVFGARGVFDVDAEAAERVARASGASALRSIDEAIERAELVVVASPTALHFDHARRALEARRHVLVEKPIASTSREARALCEIARANGVRLFVGHSERFNAAVRALREACARETIMSIATHRSAAAESGDVCLNLGVHDIDLVALLARAPAAFESANGDLDDVEIALVAGAARATVRVSRSAQKVRSIRVQTTRDRFEANLLEPSVPEPLALQAIAVQGAIEGLESAVATGEDGLRAVAVAEAASARITESRIFAAE